MHFIDIQRTAQINLKLEDSVTCNFVFINGQTERHDPLIDRHTTETDQMSPSHRSICEWNGTIDIDTRVDQLVVVDQ